MVKSGRVFPWRDLVGEISKATLVRARCEVPARMNVLTRRGFFSFFFYFQQLVTRSRLFLHLSSSEKFASLEYLPPRPRYYKRLYFARLRDFPHSFYEINAQACIFCLSFPFVACPPPTPIFQIEGPVVAFRVHDRSAA